eukprot:TRINITY_DN1911_c1_g1_i1.p1 TRINITY_DN1911_c1_g1~~TRINITY_DN1911_c1_g1_i1.p1  ORF type:complete len:292 (-),score=66.85 TRINITY_DN1911_c1_g1_i1:34-909(-)
MDSSILVAPLCDLEVILSRFVGKVPNEVPGLVISLLSKCQEQYTALKEKVSKQEGIKSILTAWIHTLLDITFLEENVLSEGEFKETVRVIKLLEILDQPDQLQRDHFKEQSVIELFGIEVSECLLWRKGALRYMIVFTFVNQEKIVVPEGLNLLILIEDGVKFLEQMISIRKTGTTTESEKVEGTLELVDIGIYSDTHLFSMIYAGQLCFWGFTKFKEISGNTPTSSSSSENNNNNNNNDTQSEPPSNIALLKSKGKAMLTTFIRVIKEVLEPQGVPGWSIQRAQEILEQM